MSVGVKSSTDRSQSNCVHEQVAKADCECPLYMEDSRMGEYDKVCIETFLRDQLKLFPEKVAETPEEAEDFLDMCMAAVCKNMKEVREYFDETGADIAGMSKEELEQADEVFKLPDGRYLVVDA